MATFSRVLLSGGTSGAPIPVAAPATPGTLLHTAVAGATSFDEDYLWASNVTTSTATLTIECGGATDPASHITKALDIPAKSAPSPAPPALSTSPATSTGSRLNAKLPQDHRWHGCHAASVGHPSPA